MTTCESKTLEEVKTQFKLWAFNDDATALTGKQAKAVEEWLTKAYKAGEETRDQKWAWMRPEDRERKAKDIQILTQERSGRS